MRSFREDICADAFRAKGKVMRTWSIFALAITSRTFRPVFTLRLCQWSRSRNWPIKSVAKLLHRIAQAKSGMDFSSRFDAGPGLLIVHGWGTVVSLGAQVGSNVTLFNGVVLGRKDKISHNGRETEYPVVGDDVWIGPHAIIIGGVKIGDGAIVGGGSVVTKDVPAHCVVAGNPAKVLRSGVIADVTNRAN